MQGLLAGKSLAVPIYHLAGKSVTVPFFRPGKPRARHAANTKGLTGRDGL